MRSENGQRVYSFGTMAEAMDTIDASETVIVTRKTGRRLLEDAKLLSAFMLVIASDGEPKLADLLSFETATLRGSRRVVSIGGGSVIDFGKGLIARMEYPEVFPQIKNRPLKSYSIGSSNSTIEHIVIPTIAGSGAEASSSALFSLGVEKIPIFGPGLLPSKIFWVPSALDSRISANAAGILDMLGHSVESLFSTKNDMILDLAAMQSIDLFLRISDRSKLGLWDNLQLLHASFHSGVCQDKRLVSVPHALAHNFAESFPHGLLVGNFLSQFLHGLPRILPEENNNLIKLFLQHNLPLEQFRNSLTRWVEEANVRFGVREFKPISDQEALASMSDPASRLSRVKLSALQFREFNFQRPIGGN